MNRPVLLWHSWSEVARRLAAPPRLALFCDFDGTLAPLAGHPDRAHLPVATRAVLERLGRLPRMFVGVVSGRSLRDLRRRVGLRKIYYIGSHGLEWAGPNGQGSVRANVGWQRCIRELREKLQSCLDGLPGIYVEPKTVSIAVHYRNARVSVAERALLSVRHLVQSSPNSWRLLEGKKVLEVLPPAEMDKGRAVLEAVGRIQSLAGGRPLLVFLGDDVTDETVFVRLRRADVGIHVGAGRRSRARYRLRSPVEVGYFLQRLEGVVA